MKKFCVKVFIIMFLSIDLLIIPNETFATKEVKKLHILFISSYNANFITFDEQVSGIKDVLGDNVNLRIEYMDFKVFENDKNEEDFYNLLRHNVNNYDKFDAVITADDEALEFCIKYRESLFKGIPISFLGVGNSNLMMKALELESVSGVSELESIEETIRFIKKFHKNTKNIIFLNDYKRDFYDEQIKKYFRELTFEEIRTSELSIDEFEEVISHLGVNDAIITLDPGDFKDSEWLSHSNINKIITQKGKNIPIYNVLRYGIGYGSIGGKVISHFNQGKKAAEIVLELLKGEDGRKIYIEDDSANEYIFDYRVLKEFGIKRRDLPKNSTILNYPIDLIKQYKSIFIAFLALINIIIVLLVYILYKNKYKKEIIRAKNATDKSNRLKDYFITNISHELKTPINVIISAIQLIDLNNSTHENWVNNFNVIKKIVIDY